MAIQIQYRRGTAAEWTAANPTLAIGEPGYETDTGRFKVGTGSAAWSALPYASGPPGLTIAGMDGMDGDEGFHIPGKDGVTAHAALTGLANDDHTQYLLASGARALTGTLNLGTVGQIAFPATQNASANANTLDDYEEGTATLVNGGTATYSLQLCAYTKMGRIVTFQASHTVNVLGTGSSSTLSGLPFVLSPGYIGSVSIGEFISLSTAIAMVVGAIDGSTIVFQGNTAVGVSVDTAAIWGNGTNMDFSGTYQV